MKWLPKKVHEDIRWKFLAVLSLATVVLVNAVTSIVPLNNKSAREISELYPNLFAPAEITGAILIIIFLAVWAYVVYQFSPIKGEESTISEGVLTDINKYFVANSILNISWLFAWQYEIMWLAVLIVLGIFYALLRITGLIAGEKLSMKDRLFVQAPFSLYFGWVTFATLATIMTWLVSIDWDGFGLRNSIWAVFFLIVTAAFVITVMYRRIDWVYGTAVVWTFAGILLKHLSASGWNGAYPSIILTLVILLSVMIVVTLYIAEKDYRQKT